MSASARIGLGGVLLCAACGSGASAGATTSSVDDRPDASSSTSSDAWFRDVTIDAGIRFRRSAAQYGSLADRFSGGVCALDVDGDGALDLFFPDDDGPRSAKPHLFRQVAPLRFVDETEPRGLSLTGPMRGCLAFDLEGDGDPDLLLTGLGGARLFRNEGGRFVDASALLPRTFVSDVVYTSAVAFDADGDGDLDVAIGAFGRYVAPSDPSTCTVRCDAMVGNYEYGGLKLLLRDDDGAYRDESDRIGRFPEPSLVLLATDLDDDGRVDLFVGNDLAGFRDRYLVRREDGGFDDRGAAMGIDVSASKSGISSMSTFDADVDGDGHLDLVESGDDSEANPLFRCVPGATPVCADVAESLDLDLGPRTFRWGQALVDFDHDGVVELFEALGHYELRFDASGIDHAYPTAGAPLLWHRDDRASKFTLSAATSSETAGRGAIAVDLDRDGDLDVVVATALGSPIVLENVRIKRGNALTLSLVAKGSNRDAIGAHVRVHVADRIVPYVVHAGSSFLSSSDPSLHVGLGAANEATVEVDWPSGARTIGLRVPASEHTILHEP